MRHEDARHRLFPVGLYATLLIGLFGVTFPELLAPVEAGDRLAKLQIKMDGKITQETPLYAAEDVAEGTITQRAMDAMQELIVSVFRF